MSHIHTIRVGFSEAALEQLAGAAQENNCDDELHLLKRAYTVSAILHNIARTYGQIVIREKPLPEEYAGDTADTEGQSIEDLLSEVSSNWERTRDEDGTAARVFTYALSDPLYAVWQRMKQDPMVGSDEGVVQTSIQQYLAIGDLVREAREVEILVENKPVNGIDTLKRFYLPRSAGGA